VFFFEVFCEKFAKKLIVLRGRFLPLIDLAGYITALVRLYLVRELCGDPAT